MTAIKVLIVDDQPLVRQGLQMSLSLEEDITVIGEAENGKTALKAVEILQPDVVIMDLEMPVLDGLGATGLLKTLFPGVHVIILSIHSTPSMRRKVLEAGASAFVEKKDGVEILMSELRRITG